MIDDSRFFIIGANGQLGIALRKKYPKAQFADKTELDITDRQSVESFDWSGISTILNTAAFTNVDGAETPEGRVAAWKVNASAVANLTRICRAHDITLVHISSDYVFDGTREPHFESEDLSPLSVYGASKAAGDLLVEQLDKFYLLRTTWVIGEGKNFVRTMLGLAEKNISPTVVNDQVGRLTFTSELGRIIDHLLSPFKIERFISSKKSRIFFILSCDCGVRRIYLARLSVLPISSLIKPFSAKIGRASCRERV